IAVGDFNGDHIVDFAMTIEGFSGTSFAPYQPGRVRVFLGDGTGRFSLLPGPGAEIYPYPKSVVVGNFNGDSFPDIAVAQGAGQLSGYYLVEILLGDGSGGFTRTAIVDSVGYNSLSMA